MKHLKKNYIEWPYEIALETYARCNAACTFCPYTTLDRIGQKMPDEMIDRIIEELKGHPHPFIFAPFKVNEPFLDKRLIPICRKVNDELPKAQLRLFTNGAALTDRHIAEVADLKRVVHLWVSLNSHRPDEYERLMSIPFERTAANLDRLHEAVVEGRFKHPVRVSKVAVKGVAAPDAWAFRNYVAERWPRFEAFIIRPDSWLGEVPLGKRIVPNAPCSRWYEMSITATGKAALCCMDGKADYSPGDLNEQTLFEVYNNPALRTVRETMADRAVLHPCATCSY